MAEKSADLRQQLLLAALDCSDGELGKTFSSEELLVAAWRRAPASWGLRGYEHDYPDSNRIHRELDSRGKGQKGIVGSGFLEKVSPRTYRLTPKGFAAAAESRPDDPATRERTNRVFEAEVRRVIEHPAFIAWLQNPASPRAFRDAGHFWGIAPGTPPQVLRRRVQAVEDTLASALRLFDERQVEQFGDKHGRPLFDRRDVERGLDFQHTLKDRFAKDLAVLTGSGT